jgi:hypothetical protein
MLAKRCGAKSTTLAILWDGAKVVQGSGAIIDWAESKVEDPGRSLNPRSASRSNVRSCPVLDTRRIPPSS